jgi:hypothetical protein
MTISFSTIVRNARLDAIESAIGASPVIKLRTGNAPVRCSDADSGTVLVTYSLESDWSPAAASAAKSMINTHIGGQATATGTPGHYRMYDSSGVCHMQGTVGLTVNQFDMIVDKVSIEAGQNVNIISWVITDGNP